jgi:metallo-beta-lactamase family protein
VVVLESTYGDREHEDRRYRHQRLRKVLERAMANKGTVLIPAFSIGRTQELLYELEDIIHAHRQKPAAPADNWDDLDIVVDSPLAADFTAGYREPAAPLGQAEARKRLDAGRHPLAFEQVTTIDGPRHPSAPTVEYLARSGEARHRPRRQRHVRGGRVVNYLKAMLGDPRHDVLFRGLPGRAAPRGGRSRPTGRRAAGWTWTASASTSAPASTTLGGYLRPRRPRRPDPLRHPHAPPARRGPPHPRRHRSPPSPRPALARRHRRQGERDEWLSRRMDNDTADTPVGATSVAHHAPITGMP